VGGVVTRARWRRAAAPAALVVGYLVGSVPVAGLVGRRRGVDLRAVGDRNPGWWNARATWGARGAAPVLAGDVAKGVVAGLLGRAVVHAGGPARVVGAPPAWGLRVSGHRNGGLGRASGAGGAGPRPPARGLRVSGHRNGGPTRATGAPARAGRRWPLGYAVVGAAMAGHAWPVFAGFRGGRSVLTWVGGTVVLAPRPAAAALATCVVAGLAGRDGARGARLGVASLPAWQLLLESPHRTAASGALMSLIGLRFARAGRSAPATSVPAAAPRG
jgi:glycerol-3-phosphate acyltransferase PlsY